MYASRQMSQIDIVFWSLDIGKCLDMTLAYWSLDLGRCHSQMSRHPYRSQISAPAAGLSAGPRWGTAGLSAGPRWGTAGLPAGPRWGTGAVPHLCPKGYRARATVRVTFVALDL